MSDIFISYAREDRARIQPLAECLERHGWSVFWDRKIQAGQQWHDVITQALDGAERVIVAWSKDSLGSDFVRDEAASAQARKILVPILLDLVTPPLGFRQIQTADFTGWHGEEDAPALAQLLAVLGAPPEKHGSSLPAATLPAARAVAPAKGRPLPMVPVALGAGILLAGITALVMVVGRAGGETPEPNNPPGAASVPATTTPPAPSVEPSTAPTETATPPTDEKRRPDDPPLDELVSRPLPSRNFAACRRPAPKPSPKQLTPAPKVELAPRRPSPEIVEKMAEHKKLLDTLRVYYGDVNAGRFDAERYFAPKVRVYISMENTSRPALNRYFETTHPALYQDYRVVMDDDSVNVKGARVLSFCEVSRFLEVSTKRRREVTALNVVSFDDDSKIVSFGTTRLGG